MEAACFIATTGEDMLELKAIHSRYGKAHILSDLSFEVRRGQVVSLLGRNGAGKTTCLKSIIQLVRPVMGEVLFEGRNLVGLAPYRCAKLGLGYVPEERRIFSDLTVLENLEVGKQPPRDGLPGWTHEKLFGLFPNLEERRDNLGRELSGGEQQMLSIARTLMGNPRLLLLDEPSEGIAPVIIEQLADAILQLKTDGVTVLLSEQNLHFAQLVADRVVILEGGCQKFVGSFETLKAQPDIRDAYLAL